MELVQHSGQVPFILKRGTAETSDDTNFTVVNVGVNVRFRPEEIQIHGKRVLVRSVQLTESRVHIFLYEVVEEEHRLIGDIVFNSITGSFRWNGFHEWWMDDSGKDDICINAITIPLTATWEAPNVSSVWPITDSIYRVGDLAGLAHLASVNGWKSVPNKIDNWSFWCDRGLNVKDVYPMLVEIGRGYRITKACDVNIPNWAEDWE